MAWLITDAAHKTLPLLKPRPTDSGTGQYHNYVQKARKHGEHGVDREGPLVVPCTMRSVLCRD